jgi:membrane protease YdiL (CAAX protease family)
MVLSGLVFGFIHLEFIVSSTGEYRPGGFLPIAALTILGVWFAGAFHRSGSLVVPIVGHASFNASVIALSFVPVEAVVGW